jgi:hypothetical protein
MIHPTIEGGNRTVFVGEEVAFHVGVRAASNVDARLLAFKECELVVIDPNGRQTEFRREPGTYDGPSSVSRVGHAECLNDLVGELIPGRYVLRYRCDEREAVTWVDVESRSDLEVDCAFAFPQRVELGRDVALSVTATIVNRSSRALLLVVPNRCYAASCVAYAESSEPPLWFRLSLTSEPGETRRGYRESIERANVSRLSTIDLAAGASHVVQMTFEREHGRPLWECDEWSPRDELSLVTGLVLHVFAAGIERPIRLLMRARGTYGHGGELRAIGEPRPSSRAAWAMVRPG